MDKISPELAQHLLADGAVLIIAGCPAGTEFGIDLNAYKVDEKFRGIKMIPPGVHYVYTASQGMYGDTALRTGFLHFFQPQEVVIREWNNETEELRLRTKGDPVEETKRIRDNLKELDSFLAPYDYETLESWNFLTQYITASKTASVMPACGLVRTSAEYESCPDADRPKGSDPNAAAAIRHLQNKLLQNEDVLLPNLQVVSGTAMQFTPLPDRCPTGATPAQVTQSFMDCFSSVAELIDRFSSPVGLIDECQIAFVFFLAGCSVDALSHWRKILNLLANSSRAVEQYPELYKIYLSVIDHQLPLLPDEMMPAITHTVYKDVSQLVRNCYEVPSIRKSVDILVSSLSDSMAWQFDGSDEDDPEDLPVVVET